MRTPSSVKRNIVLSLFILFAIGVASFGFIGERVHAATLHPLKPDATVQCPSYPNTCTGKPGDAFQWQDRFNAADTRATSCGAVTSQLRENTLPPHSTGTFNPPTTSGNGEITTLRVQTSRDTPVGSSSIRFDYTVHITNDGFPCGTATYYTTVQLRLEGAGNVIVDRDGFVVWDPNCNIGQYTCGKDQGFKTGYEVTKAKPCSSLMVSDPFEIFRKPAGISAYQNGFIAGFRNGFYAARIDKNCYRGGK